MQYASIFAHGIKYIYCHNLLKGGSTQYSAICFLLRLEPKQIVVTLAFKILAVRG